jgi:hypothetical protein
MLKLLSIVTTAALLGGCALAACDTAPDPHACRARIAAASSEALSRASDNYGRIAAEHVRASAPPPVVVIQNQAKPAYTCSYIGRQQHCVQN